MSPKNASLEAGSRSDLILKLSKTKVSKMTSAKNDTLEMSFSRKDNITSC